MADKLTSGAASDFFFMERTLELAQKALGWTSPNPLVGAVVVQAGQAVGEGYHQRAGTPHAEVHALRAAGELARGSTVYVNLEPCSHYGRTPPCTQALLAAGVARVVAAMTDPNPLVAGRGLEQLQAKGVQVEVGLAGERARRLNEVFCHYITTGRPFIVWKTALSLDGKIATRSGSSRWITGEEARAEAHRLRHQYDAVLVGRATVLQDNPELTVRLPGGPWKNPLRVVVDSKLSLSPEARLACCQDGERTLVATLPGAPLARRHRLEQQGVEVVEVPGSGPRVDMATLLDLLGKRNVTSLLVEGGAEVAASLVEEKLVDKVVAYVAPKLVGGREAPGPLGGKGIEEMSRAVELQDIEVNRLGRDLMLSGYPVYQSID